MHDVRHHPDCFSPCVTTCYRISTVLGCPDASSCLHVFRSLSPSRAPASSLSTSLNSASKVCSTLLPQLQKAVSLSCRAQEALGWQPRLSPSRLPSEAWQYVKSCAESVQPQDASRSHSPNTSCVSLFLSLSLSVQYSCCILSLLLLLSPLDASSAFIEPPCTDLGHGAQIIVNHPFHIFILFCQSGSCMPVSLCTALPVSSMEAVYTQWAYMQHDFPSSFIWCLSCHTLAV